MRNPLTAGAVPPRSLPPPRAGSGMLGCSGWSWRLAAALVCSSCRKLEEPWGYSGKHQGRFPRFPEQKTGSELPASMPGRADVELGMEPCEVKDPADKTTGSHRSEAASGTAEMSDGGSGPGARGRQGRLLPGWLGRPSWGTQLGARCPMADLGRGV